MRHTVLTAVVAFTIGGIATGAVLSRAETPPSPPSPMADGPMADKMTPPGHRWFGGWGHGQPGPDAEGWNHHRDMMRTFALVYRQPDRALVPADVRKIAEGFLLWQGNHSWKVTNVAAEPDGPIGFDIATPDGSTVAKFTMDPHSGKIERAG